MPPKRVAILQSSYIPWKGYFDIIASVDEFIFLEDVQFTKRDWRSRNRIKSPNGSLWLSIPVKVAGKYKQKISETEFVGHEWKIKHWKALETSYHSSPHYQWVEDCLKPIFLLDPSERLSGFNRRVTAKICEMLNIKTKLSCSTDLGFEVGEKNEQLISLLKKTGATHYVSGPSAREYLDTSEFEACGITVSFADYTGYPEYDQPFPPFEHEVSILDLLVTAGPEAHKFMKHAPAREGKVAKSKNYIPFNYPTVLGDELTNAVESLKSGHWCGVGSYTASCEKFLEQKLQVNRALLTTSCTHALEMCALLLDLKAGDEVIVPSFTFVSTASAFALRGATIVFADVRPDTLNIDEKKLESLITPRTRAVVVVHYAGIACDMDSIVATTKKHKVCLIEDNAHGISSTYRGRPLGTFGAMATLSFHDTKNFACGEGGALLLQEASLVERAEILREKGTNRSRFMRGQVDKYSWVDLGSSYVISDILAAILLAQFGRWNEVVKKRAEVWNFYYRTLADWAASAGFEVPTVPGHCGNGYHLFYLLAPNLEARTEFLKHLKEKEVAAIFHYLPLHESIMGKKLGRGNCPVSSDVSDRMIRLPLFASLTQGQLGRVVEVVTSFAAAQKKTKKAA